MEERSIPPIMPQIFMHGVLKGIRSYGEALKRLHTHSILSKDINKLLSSPEVHVAIREELGFNSELDLDSDEPDEPSKPSDSPKKQFFGFFEKRDEIVEIPNDYNFKQCWTYYRVFTGGYGSSLCFLDNNNEVIEIKKFSSCYFTTDYAIVNIGIKTVIYYQVITDNILEIKDTMTYNASQKKDHLVLVSKNPSHKEFSVGIVKRAEIGWKYNYVRDLEKYESYHHLGFYGFYSEGMDSRIRVTKSLNVEHWKVADIFPSIRMEEYQVKQAYSTIDTIIIGNNTGAMYDFNENRLLWLFNKKVLVFDTFAIFKDEPNILDLITGIVLIHGESEMRITRREDGKGYWLWLKEEYSPIHVTAT